MSALGHKFVPPVFEAIDGSQDVAEVWVTLHLFGVPDFPSLVSVQFLDAAHDAADAVLDFAEFVLCVHFVFRGCGLTSRLRQPALAVSVLP